MKKKKKNNEDKGIVVWRKKSDKEAVTFFLCLLYSGKRCVWRTHGNRENERKKTISAKNSLKMCVCEFNQIHPYVLGRSIKISNNSISSVSRTRKLN